MVVWHGGQWLGISDRRCAARLAGLCGQYKTRVLLAGPALRVIRTPQKILAQIYWTYKFWIIYRTYH
jgi:hypothetical protein